MCVNNVINHYFIAGCMYFQLGMYLVTSLIAPVSECSAAVQLLIAKTDPVYTGSVVWLLRTIGPDVWGQNERR